MPNSPVPNYENLARFLIQPFLDDPDSLKVNCEYSDSKPRVWLRVAFGEVERGRVFGRGGRNIQAIRLVLDAAAKASGQMIFLDIYGGSQTDVAEGSSSSQVSRGIRGGGGRSNRPNPSRRIS